MPTPEDLTVLKCSWLDDPIWDLETTPGFEAHHDELREYRRLVEAQWEHERNERLTAKAEAIGCPGNLKVAAYVERLEGRIAKLEGE